MLSSNNHVHHAMSTTSLHTVLSVKRKILESMLSSTTVVSVYLAMLLSSNTVVSVYLAMFEKATVVSV